jgi:hypothetical protein
MVRLIVVSALVLGVFGVALMSFSGRSSAGAPFVVDSTADAGAGSLRQAILDANADPGFDTIAFDASVFPVALPSVILLASELPAMTDPDGTSVDGTGAGVIIDGVALGAGDAGLRFHSGAGNPLNSATAKNLTVRNFPGRGIYMCGGDGILACINHDNFNSLIDGVKLISNGSTGGYITGRTVTNAVITNTVATNNGFHGFEINSCSGDMIEPIVTDNTAMANQTHGMQVNSCDNVVDATVMGNISLDNDEFGIEVNAGDHLMNPTVSDNVVSGNDKRGIYVNAGDDVIGADIARNKVELNAEEGVYLNAGGVLDDADVHANLVRNNTGDGIYIDGGALSLAHERTITGNIICGNVASGLNVADAIPQNAEGNWWGHPSGPAPGGTGDAIIGAGAGVADAAPWIDTMTASADPATTGISSAVRFQFSDAAATVFLGQGLSIGYPFVISTDIGTITSSRATGPMAPEAINAPDGTVEVLLTPDSTGQATVEIDAPCGLALLPGNPLAVDVADATPTPTPSPTASSSPTSTPTSTVPPSPSPSATATPGGEQVVWGDNNCSGAADPIDSLLTLRFDAGLSTNTGECPGMGEVVEVGEASPHPWGDVDCGGDVNPVDSLKLLRFDAGLDVAQAAGCPELGSGVTIVS